MRQVGDGAAIWVGWLDLDSREPVVGSTGSATLHYARARIMVRYHKAPLGYVSIPVAPVETLTFRARKAASVTLAAPLRAHLDADRLFETQAGAKDWETVLACPRRFPVSGGPGLSIVICTRDRARGLAACLPTLRKISFSPLEILVVDNAPTSSQTRDVTMAAAREDSRIRYTCEPRAGLSRARNHGLTRARFDVIAFTDDDTMVDPNWPCVIAAGFAADTETVCVTGLVASGALDTGCERYFDSRYSWGEAFEPHRYDLAEHRHQSRLYPFRAGIFGTGANFAIRRDAIVSLGGFDPLLGAGGPGLGGEDLDIFLRIILAGGRISYLPAALIWHKHRASVAALAEQVFCYGHGLGAYLAKHISSDQMRAQIVTWGLPQVRVVSLRIRRASRDSQLRSRGRRLALIEARGVIVGALRYRRAARQLSNHPSRRVASASAVASKEGPAGTVRGTGPAGTVRGTGPAGTVRGTVRKAIHPADLVLPISLGLWIAGICQTHVTVPGPYGLPADLPLVFYAGIALLIVSAAAELARRRPSRWRMSVHTAVLVTMLYGAAPLVYSQGRYAWLYKTTGVVQYIDATGQLNRHIDIYQNWPGFFAAAAWFDQVAGVSSPLAYAKWAQLVFELAALPLLYLCYRALPLTKRQRWIALLLYAGSNWIGQDYFSPQALATLFCLAIMAIAIRWLNVKNSAAYRSATSISRPSAAACAMLISLYFVLTFTHELSPYILAVQLGGLAVAALLRPRWLPPLLAAIAACYLLPRFSYVNSHYGLLKSIGNFFGNATTPKHDGTPADSERLTDLCVRVLSFFVYGLAAMGAWLRRRSGRTVRALLVLALTPVAVLGLQSYGQEAIFRVYLFSLPWVAALAASALAPAHALPARGCPPARGCLPARGVALRTAVALLTAVALFFPAFYGDDSFNVMTGSEVSALAEFLQKAPPGPIFSALGNAPLADTSRYYLFQYLDIFGIYGLVHTKTVPVNIADLIVNSSLTYTNGTKPVYVVVTSSMTAYAEEYGVVAPRSFTALLRALSHSPAWRLVVNQPGTVVYELPPISPAG